MQTVIRTDKKSNITFNVKYEGEELNGNDLILHKGKYISLKEFFIRHTREFRNVDKPQFEYFLQFYLEILLNRKK